MKPEKAPSSTLENTESVVARTNPPALKPNGKHGKLGKHRNGKNGHGQSQDDSLDRRQVLSALLALEEGDFTVRLPDHWTGLDGKVAEAFNSVIKLNQRMSTELERISQVVGKEGRISQR